MDFLTDWLTNWLKELLIGGIMGNLEELFDTVNAQVGEIAAQVGTTPAAWHAGVFSLIRQLSETVILPIAGMVLTFVATYELIQMLLEKNNMHEVEVANLYKWMFKTACAILILSNTFNIVMAVFDVSQSVIAQAGGLIQGSTDVSADMLAELETSLEAMDLGPLLGLWLQSALIGFTMKAMGIIIFVLVYGRMLEIYLLTSLAPIPVATLSNRELGGTGQNYIKSLFAVGFQGLLILVCVAIYAVLIQGIATSGDPIGAIWGTVGYTVLLCFMLFKTGSIAQRMYANILGQSSALAKVMDVIKRSVIGRGGASNNRPKGVLFFAGPTGTGKTETAKALARNIFGDESCCLRFDMAEYKQSQSDQKLLGAPPGYVGYEAGGQLTNAVRDNPFSIILFDEIEKAHPSILDKFLQILDDGRLTDGQGNTVYFSESIIIFTSNKGIVGTVSEIDELGNRIERNKQLIDSKNCATHKEMQAKVIDGIRNYFKYELGRPELLNRIGEDNIVVYDFIRPDVAESILKLHIDRVKTDFRDNSEIEIDTSAIEKILLDKCCTPDVLEYGGRGIRNTVESCLYTPLTRFIYDHQDAVTAGKAIVICSLDLNSSPVGIDAEVKG